MIERTWTESIYGEEFVIRGTELRIFRRKTYIMLEMMLKYSPTAYRLAGEENKTFWCAIEDTVDRARVKIYLDMKARLDRNATPD